LAASKIIERIIKRQEELSIIFDAANQPFLVNGFLYARLTDSTLLNGTDTLKKNDSYIYKGVKALKLKKDLISPVSYCIAYDLIKKFENFDQSLRNKRRKTKKLKEEKEQQKKDEIKKKLEESTLNWIERRITSALMRVGSPGINPNQLYWKEKDLKTAVETIKIHGDLKGNYIDLRTEYFHFAKENIEKHAKNISLPPKDKIRTFILNITNEILKKRLNREPNEEDYNFLLDGEKFEISKLIAKRIGKMLDKAIYKKFKDKIN
jgi:hypothetical protein